jgi:hypothetical protein
MNAFRGLLLALLALPPFVATAQTSAVIPQVAAHSEMTPDQTLDFGVARESFAAGKWADAYAKMKPIHEAVPGNTQVAKFTAEAAINSGDAAYAQRVVTPLLTSAPDDWQAEALQGRIYAEAHNDAARDAVLKQLTVQHANTGDARLKQLTQILIERGALPDGSHIDLFYSLQPWSRYNIYEMARVYDAAGKQRLRITLESGDMDQSLWAPKHPDLVAKGERMFSMDGYSDQPATATTQATQTHSTFGFFDGRPPYDMVRDRMIAIGSGKGAVLSSTGGIVPKP